MGAMKFSIFVLFSLLQLFEAKSLKIHRECKDLRVVMREIVLDNCELRGLTLFIDQPKSKYIVNDVVRSIMTLTTVTSVDKSYNRLKFTISQVRLKNSNSFWRIHGAHPSIQASSKTLGLMITTLRKTDTNLLHKLVAVTAEIVTFYFVMAIGFFFGTDLATGLASTIYAYETERPIESFTDIRNNDITAVFATDPKSKNYDKHIINSGIKYKTFISNRKVAQKNSFTKDFSLKIL